MTGISRGERAWSVHITRGRRTLTGWFSDAVWGGREPARLAARYFRDEALLRSEPDTRVRRKELKRRHRRTGEVGVHREEHWVGGRRYQRYVGEWRNAERRLRRRRFLVQRYGRKEARGLAIRARRSGLAEARRVALARQREEAARRLRAAPPPCR